MTDPTPTPDFTPAADRIRTLLDGVRDDQLQAPTPCAPWTVADLLDHLMGLTIAFRVAAEKSTGEETQRGPGDASAAGLDPDWRRVLPERLDVLAAAWRKPDAWSGMAAAGGITLPAEVMGRFGLNELIMHGWDLARATGQPFDADPANAAAVVALLSRMSAADLGGGGFGPAVPVDPDAPLLDRALGLAGRDPSWTP